MKKVLQLLALAALMCMPGGAKAQTYLSENFSSQPSGWTGSTMQATQVFAGTTMSTTASPQWTYRNSAFDGLDAGFYFLNLYSSNLYRWMITPSIDLTSAPSAQLSFDVALTAYNSSEAPSSLGADDQFMVVVSTDDGATWSETNAQMWLVSGGNFSLASIPTTWQTYTLNLNAYVGQTIKIAFYAQQATSGTDNNIHLDNVVVEAAAECMAVNQVSAPAEGITRHGALLRWVDFNNSGASYVVKNGDVVVAGPTAAGATQCTVEGLAANTAYTLTVHAQCAGGGESAGKSVSFRTGCGIDVLPWSEDFETGPSGSSTLPYCWTRIQNASNYPYRTSGYSHGGSWSLFCFGSSDDVNTIAVMPQIDVATLPLNTLRLRFWARSYDNAYSTVRVGTMSDPADPATFSEVQAFEVSGADYHQYTVQNFPAGTDGYIAFRIDGSQPVYIDDVTLDEAPACREVANLAVSSLTATSVGLSWTPVTAGASYVVKNGGVEVASTGADATGVTVAGLTPGTDYTLSVYTVCGGVLSAEPMEVSVATLCEGLPLPYSENFDSYSTGVIPSCWRALGGNAQCQTYSSNYRSPSRSMRMWTTVNKKDAVIVLPAMEDEINTTQLNFFYRSGGTSTSYGTLQVGYVTNAGDAASFVPLKQFSTTTTYTEVRMSLAQAPAGAQIAYCIKDANSAYYWYFDDITVESKTGCMMPSDVTVSDIAGSSVVLHWTDNNNGTATYRITDGANVLVAATSVGATSCTVPGLTPNTSYRLYVMANCAGDATSDADSVDFTTDCDPVAVPYFEGFEAYETGDTPDCWRLYRQGSNLSAYSGSRHTGSRSLRSAGTNNIMVLPPMDAPTNTLELHMWGYFNTSGQTFRVGYLTDLDDTTTFTVITDLTSNSYSYYREFLVPLSDAPANARIAIQHAQSNSSGYFDDITVEPINYCLRVTNTGANNIKSHSARIYWSDNINGENTTYTVRNGDVVVGTTEPGVHSLVVTGLTAKTTYSDFNVTANCSETEHSYAVPVSSFTTLSDETDILAFNISTEGVRRGDADITSHVVTMPIYYTTNFTSTSGSFTLSDGATMYVVVEDEGNTYEEYVGTSYNNLRYYLTQDAPITLRIKAADNEVYTNWTLALERENCTSPRNLVLTPARAGIELGWEMPDPEVTQYEVVWSDSPLDEDYLNNTAVPTHFSGSSYTIMGLERETPYYVYLRSDCGSGNHSTWVGGTATTKALGCNLAMVGDESTGSTSYDVPLNTNYRYTFTETIVDAAELGTEPAEITAISYFYTLYQSDLTGKTDVSIYLQPTTRSAFDNSSDYEPYNSETAVQVFSGNFSMQPGWNTIPFSQPFAWDGVSNVMVIVDDNSNFYNGSPSFATTDDGTYKTLTWYSDSQNPDIENLESFSGNKNYRNYRANMRLNVCVNEEACPTVANIQASDIRYDGAVLAWDASEADYLGSYDVFVSTSQLDEAALTAYAGPYAYQGAETGCQLTGLVELTDYYVYVRAVCNGYGHDEGNSTWAEGSFTTAAGCYVPVNGTFQMDGKNRVTVSWENGDPDQQQNNNFSYVLSTSTLDAATLNDMPHDADGYAETSVSFANLEYSTPYHFYVRNDCGENKSPWVEVPFTTYDTMPIVVSLAAEDVNAHWFTATWQVNSEQFASETAWQYAIVPSGESPTQWTTTESTTNFIYGLSAETAYDLYVYPYIIESGFVGSMTSLGVITAAEADPCTVVNPTDGTTTEYAPVYGYWTDNAQRVQSIYPAEMLEAYLGKTITGMHWFVQNGTNSNWNNSTFVVSLGITESEDLATGMDNNTPLTVHYTGTLSADEANGMTVTFDDPFVYNGGNLLVQFEEPVASGYNHVYFYSTARQSASRMVRTGSNDERLVNNLPMVQFCFVPDATCRDMMDITVENTTTNSVDISWMPGGGETQWQYVLSEGAVDETERAAMAEEIATMSLTSTSLLPDGDYYFYIRPVCAEGVYGPWAQRSFQTVATCSRPESLTVGSIGTRSASLYAYSGTIGTATAMAFRYWEAGSEEMVTVQGNYNSYYGYAYADISGLTPNTDYWFQAMTTCYEDEGDSRWSKAQRFTTKLEPLSLAEDKIYTFDESQRKDWVLVNGGEINKWAIGTGASKTANGRGLYISNDGGTTNAYTHDLAGTTTYAYSAFTFEEGKQYIVDFQWKSVGDNNDYLRAWLVPDSYEFTAGVNVGSGSDWISLTPGTSNLYGSDEWQRRVNNYFDGELEGDYKLLFVWNNDNNGGTNPPAAIDSVVVRERERYTVTAVANSDAEGTALGTIEGNTGTMYVTTPVSLQASEAPYGYHFAGWFTGADYATLLRPDLAAAFTLSQDTALLARYDSNSYTIQAVVAAPPVDPAEVRGTVAPASISVKFNLPVELTATAATGYHLTGWTDDTDAPAGSTETITVQAYRDNTFTATFDTNEYNVSVATSNAAMGSAVAGSARVKHFLSTNFTATEEYGYHFVGWENESGDVVATENPLTVSPVSDTMLTAVFLPNQYTVTAVGANPEMGTATGTATVNYLDYVTLTAENNYGYHFVNWTNVQDEELGTEATLQVQALRDSVITAHFDYNQYTVTGTSADAAMGSVEGTATVNYLTDVTLIATANYGYHFVSWTNAGGDVLGTNPTIVVQALRDSTVTAHFDYNQYTVTGTPDNADHGTVSGSATVNYLSFVALEATPATGYHFVNWTNAQGEELGTETTLQVQALRDSAVTAHFDINVYDITVNVVADSMGSVAGAEPTEHFQSVTLTATANYGYHFVNWTNETGDVLGTEVSLTVAPTSDTTVVANFDFNQYSITGTPNVADRGTVSGSATVNYLTSVVLTATPETGYHFVNWTNAGGDELSTEASITIQALRDSAVTAHFDINVYDITVNVVADGMGGVAGAEPTEHFQSVTLTATANYGYHFVNWTSEAGDVLGTESTLPLAPTADVVVNANFDYNQYTVTATTEYAYMGSVDGGATVNYLESVTLEASPATGYHFVNWTDASDNVLGTETTLSVQALRDSIVTAHFDTNVYNIAAVVAPASAGMGTATVTGRHMHFLTDIVEAIPNDDCHFTQWSDGSTENPRTVVVDGDAEYEANFAYNQHTVTLAVNDPSMGTAYGDGTFSTFSEVTVEAVPADHYHFLYWQQGANTISSNPYNFTLEEDVELTAMFVIDEHSVSVAVENGSVNGAGTYDYGTEVTLTATPVSLCYHFDGWMENGSVVSMDEEYTFTLTGDRNLSATFARTNYDGVEAIEACDSYTWHGQTFTESNNTATFATLTNLGCDSTTTLNLTINHSADVHIYVHACEYYIWNSFRRTQSGTYSHSAQTVAGCDSLTRMHLTIGHHNTGVETVEACDSYTWHGQTFTESNNEATFRATNADGCDSIVTLALTLNVSTQEVETVTACDSYTWHDVEYTASTNEPTFVGTNAAGCSHTVTLDLTVNSSSEGSESATVCDSYSWNGQTLTESGVYTASLVNAAGCDSTATLTLTVNHSSSAVETVAACDSYTWHGQTYTSSTNEPVFQTTNAEGCDSTVTLNLTIAPTIELTETVTACDNYTWHGQSFTESNNTATYTSVDANGCNVVTTLNLTLNHSANAIETVAACDSYTWHGQTFASSNSSATFTTLTTAGCDSTVTLHLTVNASTSGIETATACDSYSWHGQTYTASTSTPTYSTVNAAGCDSTVTLHLTVNQSTNSIETATACDSYMWHDNNLTYSGVFAYTTTNAAGCDSVVSLHLTVNYSTAGAESATACDSYTWQGETYTESGIHTATLTNALGCDSTVTLTLTLNASTTGIETVTATDSYTWIDGETYTESTDTPSVVLTNAAGCDSTVTLHLTIVTVPVYSVTVLTADAAMGTVSPAGVTTLAEGSTFTATATALPGRHFVGWGIEPGYQNLVTDNPLTVTVNSDVTLTAYFEYDDVTATLSVNDATMGTTDPQPGTYTFHVGDTAHARAIANPGYQFVAWVVNGVTLDVAADEVDVEVTEEMAGQTFTIEAVFEAVTGIGDVDAASVTIATEGTRILVSGAAGAAIDVYDAVGRRVRHMDAVAEKVEIDVLTSGIYLVRVGNAPARRVAVVR